ncbi:hypothetical protein CHLNCDRAFT_139086 [Chlorella variabilis]|uniref:Uncharacterized protein n=1 Tax=Chlorella variabilis TaxID=554065 RepID=E1ZPC0_CHLVA|nr:hypothetical protein CHLNCDRAFT_139086 [Chlorella variabilis]EFN52311.1 hypothetical protein CHLNCDRAFT_139086 [Chlorella variabilis]|eukprot:XP_005844413.1 hypothetical protein CHLNCDRAFT_139086 [Chlorella variabilis]
MLHPTSSSTLSDWSTSWSNGHFKRKAVRTSAQPGFQEAFATLFALEMQDLLGIKEDGPLPPKGTRHDLGDVVRGLKEGDGAQDYSISALKLFNHYLHSLHSKISYWNQSDAIYASGAVFTLAASPWLDYIIIDSNFMTTAMLPTRDVRVVQLLLSAMKPYGKQVFFEGAFERISDPEIHRRAVMLTATSGAHGIGFTNWLDRVGPTFFNDTLQGLPLPHSDAPPVAVLTPYRSYLAYKGTPKDANGVLFPTDPQQDRLFACLDEVEKELPSLDGLQIFGVPTMLLPVLQTFEQVWYVEPDVLLSGDASTIARIKERAGALGVPLRSCIKKKAPAIVLPECCPSM